MNSKFSLLKSIALTAALLAGVSGMAQADDNDMSLFGGDGYAYFHQSKPVVDKARSVWSQTTTWAVGTAIPGLCRTNRNPTNSRRPSGPDTSSWRESHPHGLTERELQAMSNEDPTWQYPLQSETSALASSDSAAVTESAVNESFTARIATFFHVSPAASASTK